MLIEFRQKELLSHVDLAREGATPPSSGGCFQQVVQRLLDAEVAFQDCHYSLVVPFDTCSHVFVRLTYAADTNMSVREAAWMAFRPHLQTSFSSCLALLEAIAGHIDANCRRFAVEVTRPRSVWGSHLKQLKLDPNLAAGLWAYEDMAKHPEHDRCSP